MFYFKCHLRIDWRPHRKERQGVGAIARIQHSDSEDQLYGDRNENNRIDREVAAVVGGLDIVGKKMKSKQLKLNNNFWEWYCGYFEIIVE